MDETERVSNKTTAQLPVEQGIPWREREDNEPLGTRTRVGRGG